ncbi:hypothetical protein BDR03DRAFT_950046 [Suillus americanus]|nr:hypothetical protein BDR03DRAFT_950046 [Suillus americanus]
MPESTFVYSFYYRQRTFINHSRKFLKASPPPPHSFYHPSYIYSPDPSSNTSIARASLRRRIYHIIPHFNSLLISYGWLHIYLHTYIVFA